MASGVDFRSESKYFVWLKYANHLHAELTTKAGSACVVSLLKCLIVFLHVTRHS